MSFDPNHPQPAASVGILTRNAGTLFHRVVENLRGQETPWPFEVVILDSASKDGTDKYAESQGARVVPYRPKKFKFGAARDTLFENCRGTAIATISQDVVPADPQWLARLVEPILDGQADATVGEQAPPAGGHTFHWDYHGSWMRSVPVQFDRAYGRICLSGANMAIRRSVWEKLRFGDVEAIEDRVMQVKLQRGGYRMMQVPGALSFHGHDYSWKELVSRNASFAMGFAEIGWPYTFGRLVRDLMQPSRYAAMADAFLERRTASWQELLFPVTMCFIQYRGSSRKKAG